MKHKLKFDSNSLIFKLWAYFALFAALLMVILWFLQIFFLRTYYEEMKLIETRRIANTIIDDYGKSDFLTTVYNLSMSNDLYVLISSGDKPIFSFMGIGSHGINQQSDQTGNSSTSDDELIDEFLKAKFGTSLPYSREIQEVRSKLLSGHSKTTQIIIPDPRSSTNTLAYGVVLDDTPDQEIILYLLSPLYPVDSTVDILANQLLYVTAISLVLAFVLSLYLSNRIARPIRAITKSASKLAEGKYGITFEGGHYTEIIRLAETLTQTSKELAKADNLQKDLIANVSHDLRTPLTMIKSYAEMIRDLSGNNPEKRGKHLQVIIEETDRLNQLVGDLLVLSKMQSGVETLNLTEFNLKETVESLLHSYEIYVEQEGFDLNFVCDEDAFMRGDEARMKQVLTNLLNNAVRYSGEIKVISIVITQTDEKIKCEIIDSGQGIKKKELAHIWQRYYKASSNHSRNTTGSGLGLSIVKEILQQHDASFGVESEPGRGSNFWFEVNKSR